MEFKPGVGGSESALFLSEVVRMYTRFCESRPEGWKIELLSSTPIEVSTSQSGAGDALKDAILEIKGDGAFGALRFEAGVHRVQRIPTTQNLGKLQSSTIAVVVLPASSDGEKKDDLVDPKDVKTEVMRSRGAGGQVCMRALEIV